jgi:hypothetical protein
MQKITSSASLKDAILLLHLEQAEKGQLLKEQLMATYESFRPVNLLKSALHDISSSPFLLENLLSISMGITSGFLTNKIFVGKSGNLVRKVLGSLLQFSVTNAVASSQASIRSIGSIILHLFLRKKKQILTNSER